MKKSAAKTTKPKAAAPKAAGYPHLVTAISAANTQMVGRVATVANQTLVLRNWMVGAYIVQFEQEGSDRAKYGTRLLETLAGDLKAEGVRGLGFTTLKMCRLFFLTYPSMGQPMIDELGGLLPVPQISQPVVDQSALARISLLRISPFETGEAEMILGSTGFRIPQTVSTELPTPLKAEQLSRISWAHFLELIRLDDPWKRAFYEFEARQFRMTEGRKHHRVDLVFYHRLLRCHVLIDLKIRAFQPADAGQMNFYVNWFKANMQAEGDHPPVGILLCSDKDGVEVEFATAGMDRTLFVSRYLTQLPSPEQLKAFIERDRDEIQSHTQPRKS